MGTKMAYVLIPRRNKNLLRDCEWPGPSIGPATGRASSLDPRSGHRVGVSACRGLVGPALPVPRPCPVRPRCSHAEAYQRVGADALTCVRVHEPRRRTPAVAALSILSATAPESQSAIVFTGVFVIVWCGAGVITLNSKLLGGRVYAASRVADVRSWLALTAVAILPGVAVASACARPRSFFQSVCVLGYCICPLVLVAFVGLFVPIVLVRVILVTGAFLWSSYGLWMPAGVRPRPRWRC